jgi:sugar phosphate isomerase/epimerase
VKVVRIMGEIAEKHGVTVAIEPLNRSETNCVNSVIEGAMLEAAVNLPSVGLLADLYHILREREPVENVAIAKDLKHTHIARLEGRAFPTAADEDIRAFFAALKKAGYTGTMSVEGNAVDLEQDAAAALKVLRSL